MIRIDEIYQNTFYAWAKEHIPLTRLWYCDPPGTSSVKNLQLLGEQNSLQHYIYLHDQEPIYLDYHNELFYSLDLKNFDLNAVGADKRGIISSEYNSASIRYLEDNYKFYSYYYFFHGWAALDWYRGYNRTFLIPKPLERNIQHSFISANRIIGGRRDHRLLLFYKLIRDKATNNSIISFPAECPETKQSVLEIASKYQPMWDDLPDVLSSVDLPWNFPNEQGHPMTSFTLDLVELSSKCLARVVTETSFFGKKNHLTEKTFQPICMKMPFILVSNAHSLEYLQSYGFKTFGQYWDESYDTEENDYERINKIKELCVNLDRMSIEELNELHKDVNEVVEYNHSHFYNGNFEKILWAEFENMLAEIKNDFCI